MNGSLIGWTLAVAALAAGYAGWGWPGVVLGITLVVFWLLLQFSQALRVMRTAAQAPVGRVPNAVMLHARLKAGQRLMDIIRITRSLGQAVPRPEGEPETFVWQDEAGDRVQVELQAGRVTAWALQRRDAGSST
jgi:uncharacterized protein (DUF58 family)